MFHKFFVVVAMATVGLLGYAQSQGYDPFASSGSASKGSAVRGSSGAYHK